MDVRAHWWDDSISSIRCWCGSTIDSFCQWTLEGFVRRFCFVLGFLVVGMATFVITIRLVPFARFASSRAAALLSVGTFFLPRQFVTLAFGVKLSLWRNALQFLST